MNSFTAPLLEPRAEGQCEAGDRTSPAALTAPRMHKHPRQEAHTSGATGPQLDAEAQRPARLRSQNYCQTATLCCLTHGRVASRRLLWGQLLPNFSASISPLQK